MRYIVKSIDLLMCLLYIGEGDNLLEQFQIL